MTRVGMALALILLFVWSVPGTIALRWVLLVVAIALLLPQVRHVEWRGRDRGLMAAIFVVALLTAWYILHAAFISTETRWVFGELRGQWLPALLASLLGILAGLGARDDRFVTPARIVTGIVLVLAAQALIVILQSVWYWVQNGVLLRTLVPLTGGKLELTFVLNILLAILTVDLFCRISKRPPILALSLATVLLTMLIAFIASYIAASRNGIFGILFLSISAVSLFVFDQRKRLGTLRTALAAGLIVVALGIFVTVNVETDPRWLKFSDTAVLAWNMDPASGWEKVEAQWPQLRDGSPADHSAFIRIAFWRTGLWLIEQWPLGYGFGRNAFGHAMVSMGHPVHGHAHSGWLDVGIGGGIPALLIWTALITMLMYRGWRSFFSDKSSLGLLMFFLATGYAGRMFLDSVNKDHMLQIFMFLSGVLLILTSSTKRNADG